MLLIMYVMSPNYLKVFGVDSRIKSSEKKKKKEIETIRATSSHTRLRAHDHYKSSTLIGREGRTGPSSLHTALEGLMKYVNARSM